MGEIYIWLKTARPRTLPLSISGILFGSGIAFTNQNTNWVVFSFAVLTTLLFQILSNFANDYGDGIKGTDNKDRIGPQRGIQSGEISLKSMRIALLVTAILAILSAGTLIYVASNMLSFNAILTLSVLGVFAILAALFYTIGKKAYGYHGLGDVMVFIFFGLVSVLGVFALYSESFDWNNLYPASTIGLLCVAVLNLNNMRDYYSDKKAEKNTFVVRIGPDFAKMYHALLLILALAFQFYFLSLQIEKMYFISLLPWAVLLLHLYKVMQTKSPKEFDPELKKVALSTFGIGLLYFVTSLF